MYEEYNGLKVFSATKAKEREGLGAQVTHWIRNHPECKVVNTDVLLSSDSEFHCLAIIVFYMEKSFED